MSTNIWGVEIVTMPDLTLDKTLMILLLPLFMARAAEQAWLLLCLIQKVNLLDIILDKRKCTFFEITEIVYRNITWRCFPSFSDWSFANYFAAL